MFLNVILFNGRISSKGSSSSGSRPSAAINVSSLVLRFSQEVRALRPGVFRGPGSGKACFIRILKIPTGFDAAAGVGDKIDGFAAVKFDECEISA